MLTDLDRWPSWLWVEQKESKRTVGIRCSEPLESTSGPLAVQPVLSPQPSGAIHTTSHLKERPLHTHCRAHLRLQGLGSFLLSSSQSFGDWASDTWGSMDFFAFHFEGFLRTAAELPRPSEKGWSYYIFSQTASWEKWKYYEPIFLKSLSELLQEFLGCTRDLKREQPPLPKSICFFSFSSSLKFKYAIKAGTIAPQSP